jgi:carbonic anhydrase
VDHWLTDIREVMRDHRAELAAIEDPLRRLNRTVELNVVHQVRNLARTPIVQDAWKRGRRPLLHGLVYDIHDGLLRPLVEQVDSNERVDALVAGA